MNFTCVEKEFLVIKGVANFDRLPKLLSKLERVSFGFKFAGLTIDSRNQ